MRKAVWIAACCNAVFLLPCMLIGACNLMGVDTYPVYWNGFFMLSTIPAVLLRCFFLQYMLAGLCMVGWIWMFASDIRKNRLNRKDLYCALLICVLTTLGLSALEEIFLAAMGI